MARGKRGEACLKLIECFDYEPGAWAPKPIVQVRLFNFAGEEYGIVKLQVDTGFEGSIPLPTDVYEFFKIAELPYSMWRRYVMLASTVTMRVVRAYAEVAGKRFEVYVETPLYGGWRALACREFLNKPVLLLSGVSRKLCVAEA